jgi:MFS family permease
MLARHMQRLRLIQPSVYLVLAAAALVGLSVDGGVFSVLFNLYLVRLSYGPETIGLVNAAGMLTFAVASIPAGMLGARLSNRWMIVAGLALTLGGGCCLALTDAIAPDLRLAWLIGNIVVLYLGLALYFVNGPPFLLSMIDDRQRSSVFSAQVATLAIAACIGSLVGGFLPQLFGAALGVPADDPSAFRLGLLVGAIVLAPAILAVLATRPVQREEAPAPSAGADAAPVRAAAAAVLGLLALIGLVRLLQLTGMAATSTFFSVYLDTELEVSTAQIGLITGVGRLLAAPAALFTPMLAARYGNHSTVFWSSLATGLSMAPLVFIPHWGAAGLSFIGVIGLSSVRYASSLVYFMEQVPPARRTAVAGVMEMAAGVSFTAMTFGGGFMAALLGYRSLFLLGAVLTVLSAVVFWVAFRPSRQPTPAVAARAE